MPDRAESDVSADSGHDDALADPAAIADALSSWFDDASRPLPWRDDRTPPAGDPQPTHVIRHFHELLDLIR